MKKYLNFDVKNTSVSKLMKNIRLEVLQFAMSQYLNIFWEEKIWR